MPWTEPDINEVPKKCFIIIIIIIIIILLLFFFRIYQRKFLPFNDLR